MASLTQRTGVLGKRLAAHLLRRTTYHITKARIDAFALKTADEAVDELLTFPSFALPAGPISRLNSVAWLSEVPNTNNHGGLTNGQQRTEVESWWLHELFQDTSMRSRLTIFHRSIWTTGDGEDGSVNYNHFRLLQKMAKGSIKTLAYKMILDIKMLYYLDNRDNKETSPNENFAREFLELFTILKGPQIAIGNYTNYTEADIGEVAKVFTGFYGAQNDFYRNNFDPDTGLTQGTARNNKHDNTDKIFSAAFGNTVITGAIDEADNYRELSDFVTMVFNQLETARAYCRRLYRFFVCDIIDAEIENDIIEPLAVELHANDYNLEITIKHLLKSIHFYDEDDSNNIDELIGSKLKSPLMLWMQAAVYLDMGSKLPPITDLENFFNKIWVSSLTQNLDDMGQSFYPSTVEGFPGYFKAPNFSRNWFDAATIATRYRMVISLLTGKKIRGGSMLNSGDDSFQADIPALVAAIYMNQEDADALVIQILEDIFAELPEGYDMPGDTSKRYNYFREALLGGLSTINWMFEWQNAQAGDPDAIASSKVALDRLFTVVMSSPEYQAF